MQTIDNKVYSYEYYIKNSKFTCYIKGLIREEEISDFLQEYSDHKATHNCYAYIFNGNAYYNDDREPTKTAGAAILAVLKMHNLTQVICLTIRYFHPPKLGRGGLVKAYQHGVITLLQKIPILTLQPSAIYEVKFKAENYQIVKKWCYTFNLKLLNKQQNNDNFIWQIILPIDFDLSKLYHPNIKLTLITKTMIARS